MTVVPCAILVPSVLATQPTTGDMYMPLAPGTMSVRPVDSNGPRAGLMCAQATDGKMRHYYFRYGRPWRHERRWIASTRIYSSVLQLV